jgi:poly(3-hydroxybutyrate) depolymerase
MSKNFFSFSLNWRTVFLLTLLIITISIIMWRDIRLLRPYLPRTSAADHKAAMSSSSQGIESGLASIPTLNYANPRLEYYFFFPARLYKQADISHPVLVVVPGLSSGYRNVNRAAFEKAAKENGWILLIPGFIFDRNNWESGTSYQFPKAWSGQALLDIMNNFSSHRHLRLGRAYLHGMSAGAQFVVRFALWRPDLCLAVSAHAGGGTITPENNVPVKFFISIGRLDSARQRQFAWFQKKASELFISVKSKIYEGRHVLPAEQIQDSIRFFEQTKD